MLYKSSDCFQHAVGLKRNLLLTEINEINNKQLSMNQETIESLTNENAALKYQVISNES
jgi:hypothetical protein